MQFSLNKDVKWVTCIKVMMSEGLDCCLEESV